MPKLEVKDIVIEYDENQREIVNEIETIIKNNYTIIAEFLPVSKVISLIPSDNTEVTYIPDFNDFFYNLVYFQFQNPIVEEAFKDPNILNVLYINLIKVLDISGIKHIPDDFNLSNEVLASLIAYKYYEVNGNFAEFVEYLKNPKDNSKIFKWLGDESRFSAYEFLLEQFIEMLKQKDFEYIENLNGIINKLYEQMKTDIMAKDDNNELKLPDISLDDIDKLFYEFLENINAPSNWKILYDELKNNGLLTYKYDENKSSSCYIDENGKLKIDIVSNGLFAFIALVHEFAHYVTLYGKLEFAPYSISELPSIFFEKMALNFLRTKGYQQETIDFLARKRIKNNINIFSMVFPLFMDINYLINGGKNMKEDKVKLYEENINVFKETIYKINELSSIKSSLNLAMFESDPEEIINRNCDRSINLYLKYGMVLLTSYQYLLDTFLADEILKLKNNNPNIITNMFEITIELRNCTLKSILDSFGLKELLNISETR